MTEKYFKIYNSDGDTVVYAYTKAELLEDLNEELRQGYGKIFLTDQDVIDALDTNYWPEEGCLIIKGRVVEPKPVKIVEEYEVD